MAEAMIGAIGSLVILALVFASFLAILPLLIGGVSVLATFLLVGGLTEVTSISQIVEFLIALIGLGVAIDYSLLVVSRWREERAAGRDNEAAVTAAMDHAGRAVVFSGPTVAIGLLSMIILPVAMLSERRHRRRALPLVSVAVAVTLLPVILADRRSSPGLAAATHRAFGEPGVLGLGTRGVPAPLAGRPRRPRDPGRPDSACADPAPGPAGQLGRGHIGPGAHGPETARPTAASRRRADAAEVLTPGHGAAAAAAAAKVPGVYTAFAPATSDYHRAGTAIVTVIPRAEDGGPAGQATMRQLEAALVPHAHVLGVGGEGPIPDRLRPRRLRQLPAHAGHHCAATFLLLTRAFRSVVLAAKAVVFNLVSLAAAYGVLTWSGKTATGPAPSGASRPPVRSRCGCRSWCSRSCSGCRWTTRCSS